MCVFVFLQNWEKAQNAESFYENYITLWSHKQNCSTLTDNKVFKLFPMQFVIDLFTARKYASKAVEKQREVFMSWGITADWNESGCYLTNQISYVTNQLRRFYELYEKKLIYRDFKPVYWSPSSRYDREIKIVEEFQLFRFI